MDLKGTLGSASEQLTQGFARLVRATPPDQLERVMATPVGRGVLEGIFWQMPKRVDRRRAKGIDATIRWVVTERGQGTPDTYDLVFEDGLCHVVRGASAHEPRVTIEVPAVEFLRIATGQSNPTQAYFSGRVQLKGDVMLAAKLGTVFRLPGSR